VAEPETPKPPQFHVVPGTESVGDALQEQIDDRGRLVFWELNDDRDLVDKLSLGHARPSPAGRGYGTVPHYFREV